MNATKLAVQMAKKDPGNFLTVCSVCANADSEIVAKDGGVIRDFLIDSQSQEVFIGQVYPGVFDDLPVRVPVEVLEQA